MPPPPCCLPDCSYGSSSSTLTGCQVWSVTQMAYVKLAFDPASSTSCFASSWRSGIESFGFAFLSECLSQGRLSVKAYFMKMSLVAEGRVDFRHVELGQLSKLRSEKAD